MNMTYLGHACVLFETNAVRLLVDPFISHNPLTTTSVDKLEADVVVVTHAHGDHWGDTMAFAEKGATVVSINEIAVYAQKQGAKKTVGMNLGGTARFPWGNVRLVPALHSSSFPDGSYGGVATGVVLELEGKRIYHAGDTCFFSDMARIGRLGLDLALLPIGDHFTMGPEEALECLEVLKPKAVVPLHFDTFPPIRQDGAAFVAKAGALGVQGHALAVGQNLKL